MMVPAYRNPRRHIPEGNIHIYRHEKLKFLDGKIILLIQEIKHSEEDSTHLFNDRAPRAAQRQSLLPVPERVFGGVY